MMDDDDIDWYEELGTETLGCCVAFTVVMVVTLAIWAGILLLGWAIFT